MNNGMLPILLLTLSSVIPAQAEDDTWWSLRPVVQPAIPHLSPGPDSERVRTDIDSFIIAKQRERGLHLAPEADRRVLIRRLYYDLIGLPPRFEDVERFVQDPDPRAYENLVDRLLASEHYGERWARHWLDVVHFGETHGYDKDKLRLNAWPYRDYVIRAFNEDKPYVRFVKEQLAGDVFWPDTADGILATGFIAAGPWDFIGHAEVPEEKTDGKIARHLDRDDMVATTMNTFCSLTVQCAQCHDHRRDPVTMEDYYSLQAVFAALDRADRSYDSDPEVAATRAELTHKAAAFEENIALLEKKIDAAKTPPIREIEKELEAIEQTFSSSGGESDTDRSPRFGYHSQVSGVQDAEKWVQVDLGKVVPVDTIALFAADEYGFADFGFPHRFRVETALDSAFTSPRVIASHEAGDFSRPGAEPVSIDARGVTARFVRVTATKLWNRRMNGGELSSDWIFAMGELAVISCGALIQPVAVKALDSIEALPRWGKEDLIDGVYGRHTLEKLAPNGDLIARLQQDASERRAAADAMRVKRDALLVEVAGEWLAALELKRSALNECREKLAALPAASSVYAGTVHTGSGAFKGRGYVDGKPRDIFVLNRGNVSQPGEKVGAGTVPGIVPSLPARFQLPADHPEGERRKALAEWITHPDNSLTWRSIVNRVWQYHFGRGIVDTPNDFGRIGGQPSHPELLDWLAVEFRDGGGSFKSLHRLILNSAVYRQASIHNDDMAGIDTSNQFLWRQNRQRLEAEAVRDSILFVAGRLDETMGGPSFQDFIIEQPDHSPHYQYHLADPDDPKTHRRAVYRFVVRSQPQPFMNALDCADPSQLVDKRGETNTALQALAMMNNNFLLRMSEHFATRVGGEADPIGTAVRLALAREPVLSEKEMLGNYASRHGLAATCRLIFNLNELSYVD
ncbi:MAG: DUF1553 domain-containing protein [Verrucomicrobiales bacterium]